MPRHPAALPEHLADGFAVAVALDAGVTARRLRAGDLESPFRGARLRVRATPAHRSAMDSADASPLAREAADLRARILRLAGAYAEVAAAGTVFSHVTAAVIWGLPLPLRALRRGAEELDVAVIGTRRAPKAAGTRGHQLRAAMTGVRSREGLTLTSPATTWVTVAPSLSIDELIDMGDAIVYIPRLHGMVRGTAAHALGTIDELRAAMDAGRRTGIAKLRSALTEVRVGAASPGETKIRVACVRAGLPEPELDIDVFTASGAPIGFTELGYPRYGLLIEYEGDHHRTDRDQWNHDIEKHAACVAAGWTPIRLTSRHARGRADAAVSRIRDALVRAGWTPGAA